MLSLPILILRPVCSGDERKILVADVKHIPHLVGQYTSRHCNCVFGRAFHVSVRPAAFWGDRLWWRQWILIAILLLPWDGLFDQKQCCGGPAVMTKAFCKPTDGGVDRHRAGRAGKATLRVCIYSINDKFLHDGEVRCHPPPRGWRLCLPRNDATPGNQSKSQLETGWEYSSGSHLCSARIASVLADTATLYTGHWAKYWAGQGNGWHSDGSLCPPHWGGQFLLQMSFGVHSYGIQVSSHSVSVLWNLSTFLFSKPICHQFPILLLPSPLPFN